MIKSLVMGLWLILCGIFFSVLAVFFWKDPRLNQWFSVTFGRGMLWIAGVRLHLENRERIRSDKSYIYIGNHQTGFDLASFGVMTPSNLVLVGKKELKYIPFFGFFLMAAGNLLIDRKKGKESRDQIFDAIEQVKAHGKSIAIFPEGTRQKNIDPLKPEMLPFKKGAFQLAVKAQLPIVPMVCSPITNVAEWERKKVPGGDLWIRILEPVPTAGLTEQDIPQLMENIRGAMQFHLNELSKKWQESQSGSIE